LNSHRTNLIIAFFLGALTVLGYAPFYLFPIPILALALLFRAWRKSGTAREAARLGFFFGLGFFGAGVSWIYVSLHDFGAMPMPIAVLVTLLFCAYLALFPALAGGLLKKINPRHPALWALCIAALWMFAECLRGMLFTGFPWLAVGYTQVPTSYLSGYAPVVGVYGVSFVLAIAAALMCLWFELGFRALRVVLPFSAIFIVGFGLQQIAWTQPTGEPVSVSLLQGNISQDSKWRKDRIVHSMETYAKLVEESRGQIIIAPETALPMFHDEVPAAYLARLSGHARQYDSDLLIGMAEYAPTGSGSEYYNAMFSLGVSGEQKYRKHHLVPFGEFVPLRPLLGWIVSILHIPMSDFSRGGLDQQPLSLAGQKVAVDICYEDVFGEEIIRQLPAATLLVNVSNDAWFGRSIGPQQHLQISQTRALETGRYMLRATNTGVTAIIDERGVVVQEAAVFVATALHGNAQGRGGATPYVRWGNLPVLLLAGLIVLLSVALRFRRAR